MKTVSERRAESAVERDARLLELSEYHKVWHEYVDDVEAREIPLYINDKPYKDSTNYEDVRKWARESVRTRRYLHGFIDAACNRCKTVLWDQDPSMTWASEPPKFWAACIGCGALYALGTNLRRYVPPREDGET